MTKREILVDHSQQMEDSIRWLDENSNNQHIVSTWGVLRAVCRAVLCLLKDKLDEERSKKDA